MFVQNIKRKFAGCLLGILVVLPYETVSARTVVGSEETLNVAVVRASPDKLDSSTGGVTVKEKTSLGCIPDSDNNNAKPAQIFFENPGKGDRLAAKDCLPLP